MNGYNKIRERIWKNNFADVFSCHHIFFYPAKQHSQIIIIIYPLTAMVAGAPQMTSQPVSSIFLCSPLPSGTWRPLGLSIPWCYLPTSSSVCLVFFPFHCALQDGFGQTWWTRDMTIPLAVCVSLLWSGLRQSYQSLEEQKSYIGPRYHCGLHTKSQPPLPRSGLQYSLFREIPNSKVLFDTEKSFVLAKVKLQFASSWCAHTCKSWLFKVKSRLSYRSGKPGVLSACNCAMPFRVNTKHSNHWPYPSPSLSRESLCDGDQ